VKAIEDETRGYWELVYCYLTAGGSETQFNELIDKYVASLLPREIAAARGEGRWNVPDGVDVLVLLVGHSVEPLLQSICYWRPRQVIWLVSNTYGTTGGKRYFQQRIQPYVRRLAELRATPGRASDYGFDGPCDVDPLRQVDDQELATGSVFAELRAALTGPLKKSKDIVIDVTGGKKSMTAGAYLFAALTPGIRMSYVDFDKYEEWSGRPYGYTCRIHSMTNPYRDYTLHEWARVRELYDQWAFDLAAAQVKNIQEAMAHDTWRHAFSDAQRGAVDELGKTLDYYHLWSNGNYQALSSQLEQEGGLPAPTSDERWRASTVRRLEMWPPVTASGAAASGAANDSSLILEDALKTMAGMFESAFHSDLGAVLGFAEDEMLRACQLVKKRRDFRAGLLRAIALNECLWRARLYGPYAWGLLTIEEVVLKQPCGRHAPADSAARDQVTTRASVKDLFGANGSLAKAQSLQLLLEGKSVSIHRAVPPGGERIRVDVSIASSSKLVLIGAELKDQFDDARRLRTLRNKVAHYGLPVAERWAYEAIDLAKVNVRDFVCFAAQDALGEHKLDVPPRAAESFPPCWGRLCELINLDFVLLPKPRE